MTIEDLSERTGVPVRTIRYYITENLLPHPSSRGRSADYTEEHLLRLRLISDLSRRGLPIARQREKLAQMSLEQIRAEVAAIDRPASAHGAAFIQSLLDTAGQESQASSSIPQRALEKAPGPSSAADSAPALPDADKRADITATWRHYSLVRGVELVVRLDAEPYHASLIEGILEEARRYRHRRRKPSS